MNPESRDSGFGLEPVIGRRDAPTRWSRPGMTKENSASNKFPVLSAVHLAAMAPPRIRS
jgi:hypothetical protein